MSVAWFNERLCNSKTDVILNLYVLIELSSYLNMQNSIRYED